VLNHPQVIGGDVQTPGFVYVNNLTYIPGEGHFSWHLGNLLGFDLPLTGGSGVAVFVVAGSIVIAVAMVALVFVVVKKKVFC